MSIMYNFNLRKDTSIRNIENLQRALTLRSIISSNDISLARGYINSLVSSDIQIKTDLEELLTVLSSVNLAIATINAERQNAIDAISALNSSLEIALGKITTDKNAALSEINSEKNKAITEINQLAVDVSDEINNLNTGVKKDLLSKIDYLFEMFYRSNSKAIMESFPLPQV